MTELGKIIEGHRDRHGHPPYASIARAIGVPPQTLDSWRNRGMRTIPRNTEPLRALAREVGLDYLVIAQAVAVDVGLIDEMPAYRWPDRWERRGSA